MRFPGAVQHEVVRCRPGIVTDTGVGKVPDQRCTTSCRTASGTRVSPTYPGRYSCRMNIVEKTPAGIPSAGTDFDRSGCAGSSRACPTASLRPTTSRSISPTSRPFSKAMRAPCCSAQSGPSGRNSSPMSPAAAPGSRARSASSRARLVAEIQRRLRNKPEVFEVPRAEAPAQQVVLDRRPGRPHRAAGPSRPRRRRRALHLGLGRFRRRSAHRASPMSACAG